MPFVISALNGLRQTLVENPLRLIAHVAMLAVSSHPRLPAKRSDHAKSPFLLHFRHAYLSEKRLGCIKH